MDPTSHAVDPSDEGRHRPEAHPLWNESYYLDFVAGDGSVGGYARIGMYPNLGVTWWTTTVVGPDRPTVSSMAFDLPIPTDGTLALATEDHRIECSAEAALGRMHLTATAPAVLDPDPTAAYRPGSGSPIELGMDLEWRTDGTPYHYDVTTRYELPCLVEGEVTIGGEVIGISGQGQRDHSWGVRDWWEFGWCWAAFRLDDGTRLHLADIRIPGMPVAFGYVQVPGQPVAPVESLSVTDEPDRGGLPGGATVVLTPGPFELRVDPVAFGPVLLTAPDGRTSRFPRAMARCTVGDGRAGTGWIEWNRPEGLDGGQFTQP